MTRADTSADTSGRQSSRSPDHSVDLAGTPWPLYKLEALALGLILFVVTGALTQSMQTAVLTSAAVTVVTWWTRRIHYARTS